MNPFIGLRPFKEADDYLFFGRDGLITDLLKRMVRSRFIAVLGSSGVGKSSLVKAGLIPKLLGGGLDEDPRGWKVLTLRPGKDPIYYLAESLIQNFPEEFDEVGEEGEAASKLVKFLRSDVSSLSSKLEAFEEVKSKRILIVVDQFEEVFRFRSARTGHYDRQLELMRDNSQHFFDLLLSSADSAGGSVFVLLTMRTDHLDDCGDFPRLTHAINNGIFMVPSMTRSELREAIELPSLFSGGSIDGDLVDRLVEAAMRDREQLPSLQHALMRLWQEVHSLRGHPVHLTSKDFVKLERGASIMDAHLEEIYNGLSEPDQCIAKVLFQRITGETESGRRVRDPATFAKIQQIADCEHEQLESVINAFRGPGRDFLTPFTISGQDMSLTEGVTVDISHEAIMRKWRRLSSWMDEEVQDASEYRKLLRAAPEYSWEWSGPLLGEELRSARRLIASSDTSTTNTKNEAWTERYNVGSKSLTHLSNYLARSEKQALGAQLSKAIEQGDIDAIQSALVKNATLDPGQLKSDWRFKPLYFALRPHEIRNRGRRSPSSSIFASIIADANDDAEQSDESSIDTSLFEEAIPRNEISKARTIGGFSVQFFAAMGGNLELLQWLEEKYQLSFDQTSEDEVSVFETAAAFGNVGALRWLAERPDLNIDELVRSKDEFGRTALMRAAQWGHDEAVGWLIQRGAEVDAQDKGGKTALHLSCEFGHAGVVRALVDTGADVTIEDRNKETPLFACTISRSTSAASIIVNGFKEKHPDKVFDWSVTNNKEFTVFLDAVVRPSKEPSVSRSQYLRHLHSLGSPVDDAPAEEESAFNLALRRSVRIEEGAEELVPTLVELGVPLRIRSTYSIVDPVLSLISYDSNAEVLTILDGVEISPDVFDRRASEWMVEAARKMVRQPVLRYLLEDLSVDANQVSASKETPLLAACHGGNLNAIRLLLEYGADLDHPAVPTRELFVVAIEQGYSECVEFFVDQDVPLPPFVRRDVDSRSGSDILISQADEIANSIVGKILPEFSSWPKFLQTDSDWQPVRGSAATELLFRIERSTRRQRRSRPMLRYGDRVRAVRARPLSFVESVSLVELYVSQTETSPVSGLLRFLEYEDGRVEYISGAKTNLSHAFPRSVRRELDTDEKKLRYVQFIASNANWQVNTPILEILKSTNQVRDLIIDGDVESDVEYQVDRSERRYSSSSWHIDCHLRFSDTLHKARIGLDPSGLLMIVKAEAVATLNSPGHTFSYGLLHPIETPDFE